jgi:hypothetical protein
MVGITSISHPHYSVDEGNESGPGTRLGLMALERSGRPTISIANTSSRLAVLIRTKGLADRV